MPVIGIEAKCVLCGKMLVQNLSTMKAYRRGLRRAGWVEHHTPLPSGAYKVRHCCPECAAGRAVVLA